MVLASEQPLGIRLRSLLIHGQCSQIIDMSIELTQKVVRLEKTIKELLERLERLEQHYNSENNPEEKPRRGRRRKDENE